MGATAARREKPLDEGARRAEAGTVAPIRRQPGKETHGATQTKTPADLPRSQRREPRSKAKWTEGQLKGPQAGYPRAKESRSKVTLMQVTRQAKGAARGG